MISGRTLVASVLAGLLLGCAAGSMEPAPDAGQPVAGSVGVVAQALVIKDCQNEVWNMGGGLCARFHNPTPVPGKYYTAYTCSAPLYIEGQSQPVTTGFYNEAHQARANLCARMSGQRVENRSTIPWKKRNFTDVLLVY